MPKNYAGPQWSVDGYYDSELAEIEKLEARYELSKKDAEELLRHFDEADLRNHYNAAKLAMSRDPASSTIHSHGADLQPHSPPKETQMNPTTFSKTKDTFTMENDYVSVQCQHIELKSGEPAVEFLMNDAVYFGFMPLNRLLANDPSKSYSDASVKISHSIQNKKASFVVYIYQRIHLELWIQESQNNAIAVSFKDAVTPFFEWVRSLKREPIAEKLANNFGSLDVGKMMIYNFGAALELIGQAAAIHYTSTDQRFQMLEID